MLRITAKQVLVKAMKHEINVLRGKVNLPLLFESTKA
jgi:hypothetical protein